MNKTGVFFSVIFFLNGCAHASLEEGMIAGKKISLNSEKCLLHIDNEILNIAMKPNCYFVKDDSGKSVRVEYYDDIDAHVILIVGTSAPKNPEYPLTLKRDDCGEQLQALIIKKGIPLLSPEISSNLLVCAGIGVDEKSYWLFSHS